jgi:hypothetical protein
MTDDDLSNAVQEVIECRAWNEVYDAEPDFAEWLGDRPAGEMAAIVASALNRFAPGQIGIDARDELQTILGRIVEDYQTYRVVQSRRDGEWEQVADDVIEQARPDPADVEAA